MLLDRNQVTVCLKFSATILAGLLVVCACQTSLSNKAGGKEYLELTRSGTNDNTHIVNGLKKYSVDKQIDIVLYSEDPRFVPIIASEGTQVIPYVVARIEHADTSFWDKYRLMDVLIRINRDCRCIANNSENISRIDAVVRLTRPIQIQTNEGKYWTMFSNAVEDLKEDLP